MSNDTPAPNLLLAHGADPVPILLGLIVAALLTGAVAVAWGGKLRKSSAPEVKRFGNVLTIGGYLILGLSAVLWLAPTLASFS